MPKDQDNLRRLRREWYERNREHAIKKVKERRRALKEWLEEYRKGLVCECCGEDHPACIDFHHRDPHEKEASISQIAKKKGWSIERMEKEIAKCDILCSNCHRKLHWEIGRG